MSTSPFKTFCFRPNHSSTQKKTSPRLSTMQLSMLPPALLALLPAVAGYSYGGGSTSDSGSSGPAAVPATDVTVINVGRDGLTMDPNDIDVPSGGIIEFHFYTGAHSVAQSAFDSPCTPLDAAAGNGTAGFFSGPQRVEEGQSNNVFRVVSTGNPMWYYCATGSHCQNGMVGVINRPYVAQLTLPLFFFSFLFSFHPCFVGTSLTSPPGRMEQGPSSNTAPLPLRPRRISRPIAFVAERLPRWAAMPLRARDRMTPLETRV